MCSIFAIKISKLYMRLKKLQSSVQGPEGTRVIFFSCFSKQFYHFNIFYNGHIFSIIKIYVLKTIKRQEKNVYSKRHCAEYFCFLAIPHDFFLENEKQSIFLYWYDFSSKLICIFL